MVGAEATELPLWGSLAAAASVATVLRLLALYRGWRLPEWRSGAADSD